MVAGLSEDATRMVLDAFRGLTEVLSPERDRVHAVRNYWSGKSGNHPFQVCQLAWADEMERQMDKTLSQLESLARFSSGQVRHVEVLQSWKGQAVHLAQEFVQHYRECNPEGSIGLATNGPVAAFVRAVIPLITGEKPKQGTVALYLKEHSVEILKG